MKTKRVLSALLVLAMVLALAIPAAAAEAKPPVFTKPMNGIILVKPGTYTLSATAALPAGVKATLKYQWYESEWIISPENAASLKYTPIKGATSSSLKITYSIKETITKDTLHVAKVYYLEAYYKTADGKKVAAQDYAEILYDLSLKDWYNAFLNLNGLSGSGINVMIANLQNTPVVLFEYLLFKISWRAIRFIYS